MSKESTFDRWDFIGTKATLIVVAIVMPLFTIAVPALRWVRGKDLLWTGDIGSGEPISTTGADLKSTGQVVIALPDASVHEWLISLLPAAILAISTVQIAVLLLTLVTRIQRGESFVPENVRAIRTIAATVVATTVAHSLAVYAADDLLLAPALGSRSATLFFPFGPFVVGLVIACVAEAFAHGTKIQADTEGLV